MGQSIALLASCRVMRGVQSYRKRFRAAWVVCTQHFNPPAIRSEA